MTFVMLTTVITYLFGIANSVTSRIFMDRLLTGINKDWLYPLVSVMALCFFAKAFDLSDSLKNSSPFRGFVIILQYTGESAENPQV